MKELLENNHTIKAINEIKLAAIITYVHPPNDHKNDANAFPTAPNMKLFTTKTVFNLLLSSLDKLNSLVWVKTDIPCTAMDKMAAMITIAMIESWNMNPHIIVMMLMIMNPPSAGTLNPLSCYFPIPSPNAAAVSPAKLTSPI